MEAQEKKTERKPRRKAELYMTFRFATAELKQKAQRLASAEHRSLTGWINEVIRRAR